MITNNNNFVNLVSLNLVCKKFNNKLMPIVINIIHDELINNSLKYHHMYDENKYTKYIMKIEKTFLLNLVLNYHKEFIEIYNLTNNGIEYNNNNKYAELDKIYYETYINTICPNMSATLMEHIVSWDFLELVIKDFATDIDTVLNNKQLH